MEFGKVFGLEIKALGIISREVIFKVMDLIEIIRDCSVTRKSLKKLFTFINHQKNLHYSCELTDLQKSSFLSSGTIYPNKLWGKTPTFKTKACSAAGTQKGGPWTPSFLPFSAFLSVA